ncbi:MAG: transcriptional regulator [Verrucomicrobiales bacterium]|nr:transcriptional regulator [Verrucomicrobiales bacterium]
MNPLPQRRSLVSQTADILREQMTTGVLSESLPGERELSARLRVSRPTLRAALELLRREGRLDVAQGQRRRIRQKLESTTKPKDTKRVVLLTPLPPHRMPPFVMFWVDELRQHLAEEGFDLEIQVSPIAEASHPERQLERLIKDVPAAAWVLFLSSEPMQRWFAACALPCVVAGSCFPDVALPSVDIDSQATCRHSAGLFITRKHSHIALLLPDSHTAGDQASEAGFREGAAVNGKIRTTVAHHDGSIASVCKKIDSLMSHANPATAILVARSAHALTTFTYLQRKGLRLPQDVSLISRDNDQFLDFVVPRITRYACNPVTFARRVSRIVLQLTKEGSVSKRQVLLMPELIKGETTR